jgi:hypothetical protein
MIQILPLGNDMSPICIAISNRIARTLRIAENVALFKILFPFFLFYNTRVQCQSYAVDRQPILGSRDIMKVDILLNS